TVTVSNGGGGTAPTVTITAPPNGVWTGSSIHITASASSSGSALTSLKIYGNGGVVLQTACSRTSCTLDDGWASASVPAGAYPVQAVATKAAGAWTTSTPVTINKDATSPVTPSGAPPSSGGGGGGDTTPPAISMTGPASGATVSGTVTVSATASDNVGVV